MYSIKTKQIETKPGCWNYLLCEIYKDNIKVGDYIRNYESFYNTFCHFTQRGKEYSLYSPDYTATRVMDGSCNDICGEEPTPYGFCPVEYYVPEELEGLYGFVSGCIWGDDSSLKLEFLDLSRISEGIFKRDDRFGYLELNGDLKDSIVIDRNGPVEDCTISIISKSVFTLNGEK